MKKIRKLTQNIRNKIFKKNIRKKWKNKRKFNLISSYPPFQEFQATLHFKNLKLPSISQEFKVTLHFKNFKLPSISKISSYPPFQEFQAKFPTMPFNKQNQLRHPCFSIGKYKIRRYLPHRDRFNLQWKIVLNYVNGSLVMFCIVFSL